VVALEHLPVLAVGEHEFGARSPTSERADQLAHDRFVVEADPVGMAFARRCRRWSRDRLRARRRFRVIAQQAVERGELFGRQGVQTRRVHLLAREALFKVDPLGRGERSDAGTRKDDAQGDTFHACSCTGRAVDVAAGRAPAYTSSARCIRRSWLHACASRGPAFASDARSASSRNTRATWPANTAGSSTLVTALCASRNTVAVPITAVETIGTPSAIASIRTSPCVSVGEANRKTSAAR